MSKAKRGRLYYNLGSPYGVSSMVEPSLKWTVRDLAAMPDDGWKRYEIIDGEMLVTRAPHIWHQGAGGNIHFALES